MTAAEARTGAIVRDPHGTAWPVPSRTTQGDLYVEVSVDREVLMGIVENRIVAFAQFKDSEDYFEAVEIEAEKFGGPEKPVARLMAVIFGKDVTPELKVEILMMDGVAIYEVELEPIMPGFILTVPCRLVPSHD